MEKYQAVPQGYMTVGEVAKKMGVTVRTLQYYDKKGLFSPSTQSDGGRRLYTDNDVIKLYQILSMKHLGFSLDEIKNHLLALDTPNDVVGALTKQADDIRKKIEELSESLTAIESLKEEVLQMQSVDFKKYADIIVNLQMKNEFYWLIKHLDDQSLDDFRSRFDKNSASRMIEIFTHLNEEAIRFQKEGVLPESEKGQEFAQMFWNMIMEFTAGDMSMLPKLMESGRLGNTEQELKQNQEVSDAFISLALDIYLTKLGIDPFQEELK